MKNLSSERILNEVITRQSIPKTKKIFSDEYIFIKTDSEKYELFLILRPKSLFGYKHLIENTTKIDLIEYTHTDKIFTIIKHYLAQKEFVEKIMFLEEENLFHIWTAISNYDNEGNRKEIYAQEAELVKFLSKAGFHFDFYLIGLDEVDGILSLGASIIYNKVKTN